MYVVVAYDICTDNKAGEKRLRKVAQTCQNYGQRVQKSLFECTLDEATLAGLVHDLRLLVHPREDSVRIYRALDFSSTHVIRLGRDLGLDFQGPLIL
ncbi:MAG: CRISPR-associated endonuclease Cas2 [Alicyclobacillus sp.]|nr:CRISPR-associated endonuclease Cas2 [Alicyclobacillus sp.]